MEQEVNILVDSISLPGTLTLPENAIGLALFAHGSGSSRFSSRNRFVAGVLQKAQIGTLLFDLLTEVEDQIYENRFNITLITERLVKATEWLAGQDADKGLALGYFGASTGAAAALRAAAVLGSRIKAVVSRGGRPDLAMEVLPQVKAPTLLIVGGFDELVLDLNRQAYDRLKATKSLEIIPGATHLFEEPGTLEQAAMAAASWFKKHLSA
jgi:putative phosphoribosyl transferase